jgi:hypothetical protein
MIFDQRIAERAFGMDPIQVAPPAATTLDVAGVLKIAQDAVRVALGDTGGSRYVRDSQVRPLGNREQYLSVIRDERPVPLRKHLMQLGPGRNRLRHQHTVPLRNGSDNPPDGLTSVEFGQRKVFCKELAYNFEELLGFRASKGPGRKFRLTGGSPFRGSSPLPAKTINVKAANRTRAKQRRGNPRARTGGPPA